jgi:hypothetical protein
MRASHKALKQLVGEDRRDYRARAHDTLDARARQGDTAAMAELEDLEREIDADPETGVAANIRAKRRMGLIR